MERKHATVVALAFILIGLMFFSVDTPFATPQQVESVVHEAPVIVEKVAEEPVPHEPLKMNVIQNPSFEDWDTANRPEDWQASATSMTRTDAAYSGTPKIGNYAGYIETMGSVVTSGYNYLRNNVDHSSYFSYLTRDISVAFDWYTIANPDLSNYGVFSFSMVVQNHTGDSKGMYYFLSHPSGGWGNDTSNVYFLLNNTIGSWNSFDRNITDDFIVAFGVSALSSTHYIQRLSFEISSPVGASGLLQVVIDDVSLYNSTYSSWIENGDFETGASVPWDSYSQTNLGQLEQCAEAVDGAYSANMTLIATSYATGYVRLTKSYLPQNAFYAFGPGTNVISWDWKYSDETGAGASQYGLLRLRFANASWFSVYFTMGRGTDYIPNNGSNYFHFPAPGFGTRDSWVHSEVDLYEITQAVGLQNLRLAEIRFEAYQSVSVPNAHLELLVDNFIMETHPMGNPTFDHEEGT